METLDIIQLEDLNKEWTKFLDSIPWNQEGLSISESNRLFEVKRTAWMKRMSKAYDIELSLIEEKFVR
jgi:hypothetical protein